MCEMGRRAAKINLLTAVILGLGVIAVCRIFSTVASAQSASPQTPPPASAPAPAEPANAARLRDEIKMMEGLLPSAPPSGFADRGAALYFLAARYLQLGERLKALALLQECAALDEGFDPTDDPTFAPLKDQAAFRQLVEQVRRRYPPVHRAQVAFNLAQKD